MSDPVTAPVEPSPDLSSQPTTTLDASQLKALGITGTVSAAVAIAVARLMSPDPVTITGVKPVTTAVAGPEMAAPQRAAPDSVTRLVSCGDSNTATVDGDDRKGTITLGAGAAGSCRLLFAGRWTAQPVCVVTGGTAAELTPTELAITDADAVATYECGRVAP